VSVLKPDSPGHSEHPFLVPLGDLRDLHSIHAGPTHTNTKATRTLKISRIRAGTLTHINQLDTRTAGRSKSALESSGGSRGVR